ATDTTIASNGLYQRRYIDVSLISYAEYQLFLGDQYALGKTYQPDHWQLPRVLQGQGQKPVLGASSSDAAAFCVWLTERESGAWKYRLPALDELEKVTRDKNTTIRLTEATGYWVDKVRRFVVPGGISIMSTQEKDIIRDAIK